METPVNHWEKQELEKVFEAQIEGLHAQDKRLGERLKAVEGIVQQIADINVTLQKQADNITKLSDNIAAMVRTQNADGERLKELEDRDGSKWRKMWGYIIPPIATLIVGYIFALIGVAA